MQRSNDILLNHLNYEPVIYRTLNESELKYLIIAIVIPCNIIAGTLFHFMFGNLFLGFAVGTGLSVALFFVVARVIEKIKRDKEKGYLAQKAQTALARRGLLKWPVIDRSGAWTMGKYV